jgi:hypothetical protein
MATRSWSLSIQASGSESATAFHWLMKVEAVDRIAVFLQPGDTDNLLGPSRDASVPFISWRANPLVISHNLRFKVGDGITSTSSLIFDSPQSLSACSLALLNAALRHVKFTNTSLDNPAGVEVFVARDAAAH